MTGLGAWVRGLIGSKDGAPAVLSLSLTDAPAPPTRLTPFAADSNDFALAMYAQLRDRTGNLFFSPFSVRTALAMAHAGARGETATQMKEALRISSSNETLHADFRDLIDRLNAGRGGWYEWSAVSSLWWQEDAPLRAEYVDLISQHYRGDTNAVDFAGDAEGARLRMNHWVEEKTRGRIQELVPAGGLHSDTRLVLVNTVHFKGKWEFPFPRENTRDEPFHLEGGGTVQAALMYQSERLRYMQGEGFQALELGYLGDDLSMLVLLPERREGLRDLEETLSMQMLHDCVAQLAFRQVRVFLPRFKLTWGSVDLRDPLRALGMPRAFARFQADFSGINGRQPPHEDALYLSAVFHRAFVETNEEGTEAGAGTAVEGMRFGASGPPPVFRADHPFLFAIRDRRSGAILFLGRVTDPTRQ